MHQAPGQNSGGVPKAKYPAKGVLKTASVKELYRTAITKLAMNKCSACGAECTGEKCDKCSPKEKTAAQIAQEFILRKLAGEDVMPAKIDGGGTTSPLAGMGQLKTTMSGQAGPSQSGDAKGGFGNEARGNISSNAAAIKATKRDLKGPVKTQLKQLLDEPALNAKTDSVLDRNLRSTSQAGVKIAAADLRSILTKIAEEKSEDGKETEEKAKLRRAVEEAKEKKANMMGGGPSMISTASGDSASAQEGEESDRVKKLKAILAKAKGGAVEKDANV